MKRVNSLDGIRGLAILAVFLNHIEPAYVFKILPSFMLSITSMAFNSGVLGVSFLFVLSGFLMAYIYPNPKELEFLQKRYTRIFPLFLTMSFVALLFSIFPILLKGEGILLIILLAFIVHIIWLHILKKQSNSIKRMVFISFLSLQLLMALFYAFWIMRHPPIVFNQQFPYWIKQGIIGLVNSTLTLPMGNYIPMLDGVYWSLASEILFYILYPVTCVPIIHYLSLQTKIVKYAFLFSLIPLFVGIDFMSQRLWGLHMLQFPLFYCFVTGMIVGHVFRTNPNAIYRITNFFKGKLYFSPIILFLSVFFLYHVTLDRSTLFASWIHILWAIPFAFIIVLCLDQQTLLSKFLSSKLLIFFGMISYSIYLSHSFIIHMASSIFHPTTFFSTVVWLTCIFLSVIVLSSALYYLLERPYFIKTSTEKKKTNPTFSPSIKSSILAIGGISLFYLILLSTYQSNFNFFSVEYPAGKSAIIYPLIKNNNLISMQQYPLIKMHLYSMENNLGIITLHIKRDSISNNINNVLTFFIKENGAQNWYSISTYKLNQFGEVINNPFENQYFPFGFPAIVNSKGKIYDIQLQLSTSGNGYLLIDPSPFYIRTVYSINKSQFIKNPIKLLTFAIQRLTRIFENHEAKQAGLLFVPFLLFIFLSVSFYIFKPTNKLLKVTITHRALKRK
ncbi:MAG: acyltransferase [Patescibacteria group bacterium]|nr:acyltransferase [Patescibacteria group bacterium]